MTALHDRGDCLACGAPLSGEPALSGRDYMHGVPGRYQIHVCARCGSGTTLPRVAAEELGAYYIGDYAPYAMPQGPLAAVMRAVQRGRDHRFPLSALRGGSPGTLLDIGCGRGDLAASWIADGWRAIGVEPSPEACETARARGVQTLTGTLDSVTLDPESVDAAVFRHSLEHVPDPREDLRRVYAALRPAGRVAVILPNFGSWQRRAFGERWFPLELPRHRTHFTAAGLRAALEAAGFAEIVVRPATPFITTTWSLQLLLFGRCLTTSGLALWTGYLASVPVSILVSPLDYLRGGGDFLHAAAVKPGGDG
jgi:SAM-dependent methyltransferase